MSSDCLRRRIQRGETTSMKLPSPQVVEILGLAGLDFAIFDTEHSALSFESVESLVRAAELVNLTPVVRVYDNRAPLKPRL